ncbi:MAG: GNAT family N-acetyltransferase [Pseudonocardiales bacterium]
MTYQVRRVPAETTYQLRHAVLRPHQPVESLRLVDDDAPDTASLAAVDDAGATLGTATVRREICPWQPGRADAWQLRGMATSATRRGQGIGGDVLAAAIAHIEQHGGGLLWCNARTPARSFYERAGFAAYGDHWDDPAIGPHVRMWREVAGR